MIIDNIYNFVILISSYNDFMIHTYSFEYGLKIEIN